MTDDSNKPGGQTGADEAHRRHRNEDRFVRAVADLLEAKAGWNDARESAKGRRDDPAGIMYDIVDLAGQTLRESLRLQVRATRALTELAGELLDHRRADEREPLHRVEDPLLLRGSPGGACSAVLKIRNQRGVWLDVEFPGHIDLSDDSVPATFQPGSIHVAPGRSMVVDISIDKLPDLDGRTLGRIRFDNEGTLGDVPVVIEVIGEG